MAYVLNNAVCNNTVFNPAVWNIEFAPPVDILVPGGGMNICIEMELGGRGAHYEYGVTTLMIGAPIGYPIP